MISHLTGTILFSGVNFVVLEVGGVGYKVFVSPDTLLGLKKNTGEEIALWTHQAVRENSLDLYGFLEYEELEFFELLITISGIGPKSALGILAVAPLDTLHSAISSGDTSHLTKVSGVGKKIAEKIVIELRDKIGAIEQSEESAEIRKSDIDVLEALQALGYSQKEAVEAMKKINDDTKSVNEKIKEALKILGQN